MMRGIHPHSHPAELPVTRNMPFSTKTMPSKNQPRNMTGIYLGLEGNVKPPTNRIVPPLARGRGMSQRIRTPTEQRRYKMVEQLRIKEEKKGFVGQPIKSAKRTKSSHHDERRRPVVSPETGNSPLTSPRSVAAKRWGPGKSADRTQFYDLIKKNPRNYTVVVNNGVTRSENLSGLMSFVDDGDGMTIAEALAEEVHRISTKDNEEILGLEECFKKVCKGNVESLHSLLPFRKQQQQNQLQREQTNYSTGFTVRSYRNPNQAEIMANFTEGNASHRPRTVPADLIHNRPIVPSPYFFRHHNNNAYGKMKMKALSAKSQKSAPSQLNFESQLSSLSNGKVMAAPGAGGLTRSLKSRSAAWSENDVKLRGKLQGTPREFTTVSRDNGIEAVIKEGGKQVQISMKVSTGLDSTVDTPLDTPQAPTATEEEINNKDLDTPTDAPKMMETVPKTGDNSNVITQGEEKKDGFEIEVADEDGKMGEVVIDAPEEESEDSTPIKGNVRKASISEKVEKSRLSQAYVETIKEDAEIRRKEFEKMLNEHAEIVQEIGRVNSTENLEENRDH